jgi:hypothetical protein
MCLAPSVALSGCVPKAAEILGSYDSDPLALVRDGKRAARLLGADLSPEQVEGGLDTEEASAP